ncbi:MAG: hypothetical protein C3F02_00795 [Parcubacteria group bacterium]|nr:MAG: hypothetical protein C3F02_00795 [Parcubacteria group bacterium]
MIYKNKQSGFTLLELLLYVSISALFLFFISIFLSFLLEARVKNQVIAEVEQQGLQAMQTITQTIRNSAIINSPTLGASTASLSLNTYVVVNNPTVFDLSGTALRIKEGSAVAIFLTNSRVQISGLSFQNLSRAGTPGVIAVTFTLTYVNTSGRQEYNYQKTFKTSATLRQP